MVTETEQKEECSPDRISTCHKMLEGMLPQISAVYQIYTPLELNKPYKLFS
jgi:hypothetical protein